MKSFTLNLICLAVISMGIVSCCLDKNDDPTPGEGQDTITPDKSYSDLLIGTWVVSDSENDNCEAGDGTYTFNTDNIVVFSCSEEDSEMDYTISDDGKVFQMENLVMEVMLEFEVIELTGTVFKIKREGYVIEYHKI